MKNEVESIDSNRWTSEKLPLKCVCLGTYDEVKVFLKGWNE